MLGLKHILLLSLSVFFCSGLLAQNTFRGTIIDSASGIPMSKVSIKNLISKNGTLSDLRGEFSLQVNDGDVIQISYLGYKQKIIRLQSVAELKSRYIEMVEQKNTLPTATIRKPMTQYQIDSSERAFLYADAFGYKQQKSAMSPISSLYQRFSKKHKEIRKFQNQIIEMERQNFIDTKYTPDVCAKITGIEGDNLAKFMQSYPMEYAFARTASELEIRLWIRYNWEDFKKKNGIKE